MCRNIRVLFNFDPPATRDEIESAAVQYVRKVSGTRGPSKANVAAFEAAVTEIASATQRLLDQLVTKSSPRDRGVERDRARQRWEQRAERMRSARA